jgi:3'-5' exoribonuclease
MTRRFVNQLTHGDAVDADYLVADKQLRVNRQGSLYLQVELRDKTGTISSRFWNATEALARTFDVGDVVHARGKTQVYQGSLQVILTHIEAVDPAAARTDDLVPTVNPDHARLVARLRELLLGVSEPHLKALVECFLMDGEFLRKFTAAPAGVKNHHAYPGGLLEHVVTLLGVAERVVEFYPEIDRDLLLAGAFLHDVGKIDELTYDRGFAYSDEGQLVGHLVMGVEVLDEKATRTEALTGEPFPRELLLRLKHMIVSHHGSHEFGSPKLPMTLEAVALHYLDNLDAKVHAFSREIRDDPCRESSWTPYQPSLGRRIYKGPPPPSAATPPPDAPPVD